MSIQLSTTVRNARLDQIETTIGASPTLCIFSGAPPANCATANTGTVLATLPLPSDWMAAASGGSKALSGTWQDLSADASGTAGHFRIFGGGVCHLQGNVNTTSADMIVATTSFSAGVVITVNSFTLTDGNA